MKPVNSNFPYRKYAIWVAALLLVGSSSCKKAPPPPPAPHAVIAMKPLVCDVPIYSEYIGHVVAKRNVEVMAQVSGILTAQYFEEGQEVKKGDLLLVIDPRPFEADLARAEATVAQTYATLHYNKETTVRFGPLVQQDFISQLNYDQYVTNVLVSEAIAAQNKASLEIAKINLGYCYITAPMDCVTGKLQVKTGNFVDSNSGTQLTLLNQIQPILVDFFIPETDLFTIQQRQRNGNLDVVVYPDPTQNHGFEGKLTLIDNQVNIGTGAILLEGTLSNEEKALWPGHFVAVRLILGQKKGALLLPSDSVMIGQNGRYVYIVKPDSTVEARNVTVGQTYENKYTAVESGIAANDTIVTQGQLNLYPGMKVQVKNLRMEQPRTLDHE
jgi:membrane fusion protein, multidrug efflux system